MMTQSTAVITFGRYQYPHIGHQYIFDTMRKIWMEDPLDRNYFIFMSKTCNKKNPLSYINKVSLVGDLFPAHKSRVVIEHPGHIIGILKQVSASRKHLIFVCGPDRVVDFTKLIEAYNGVDYNFESIKIVGTGSRNDNAIGVEGASGTKIRQAVCDGDFNTFKSLLPKHAYTNALDYFCRCGGDITHAKKAKYSQL